MSWEEITTELTERLKTRVLALYGHAVDRIVLQSPPRLSMGDLATPLALELAKALKKPPRQIAQEIIDGFQLPFMVSSVTVEGAGYLNFRIDRGVFVATYLRNVVPQPAPAGSRVTVEHTNINPNKAAHIGHIRNAVLGDTFVRCLRWLGDHVETQNYIDDTGVQVADVVVGFQTLLGEGIEDVKKRIAADSPPFDYFCWDLYSKMARHYEENPDHVQLQRDALHKIEKGEGETAQLARLIANAIVRRHLQTMARLDIEYDILIKESDILHYHFWDDAFRLLKESGAVVYETSGKHKGCWVMKLADSAEFEGMEEPDKILVRSNGTVTYVGKDIAYQLWKFGLLGRTFSFREFTRDSHGHRVWESTSEQDGDPSAPDFGRAQMVVNVIDTRQAYLQKIVKEGLRLLGHPEAAERSIHFSYEMVALTPQTAAALGMNVKSEDEGRAFLEMSGRKGLGVKADDLLDALESKAGEAIREELREASPPEERASLAHEIAVAALRYFMLKFGKNKVIAFDFNEALAFEGDSGPYLQYSTVRADNIFRKLVERNVDTLLDEASIDRLAISGEMSDDIWEIVRLSAETPATIRRAVEGLELSVLTHHALELAQKFNSFYHKFPILNEPDPVQRQQRAACAEIFRRTMRVMFDLLGIVVPARM